MILSRRFPSNFICISIDQGACFFLESSPISSHQDPSTVTGLDGEKTVSDAGATKVSVGSRFGLQDLPHFFEAKKWGSSQRPFS